MSNQNPKQFTNGSESETNNQGCSSLDRPAVRPTTLPNYQRTADLRPYSMPLPLPLPPADYTILWLCVSVPNLSSWLTGKCHEVCSCRGWFVVAGGCL